MWRPGTGGKYQDVGGNAEKMQWSDPTKVTKKEEEKKTVRNVSKEYRGVQSQK